MITFKAVIIPNNRRKDGTYPVKIRVTFKGVSRRLATTLVCTTNDLTRSLHIKSPDILNKTDALISKMRDAVKDLSPFDLNNKDVDWVVAHIKDSLSGDDFRLDFFEWADKFLLTKEKRNRQGYETAVNSFARFLGKRQLDINAISKTMVMDYMEYVDNEPKVYYVSSTQETKRTQKGKSSGTSTRYVFALNHIFNSAKDRYNDEDSGKIMIPKSPFARIQKKRIISNGQKSIGLELMQKMIDYKTDKELERFVLDIFIVSFGMMGANLVDLFNAKPVKNEWIYNRSKTKDRRVDRAEMRVDVPIELKPYLDRLKGDSRHWLCLADRYSSVGSATNCINNILKKWCEKNDAEPMTFYAARHTWSSLARNVAKIDTALVDECLCHLSNLKLASVYIDKDFSLMNEANRKVIDLLNW